MKIVAEHIDNMYRRACAQKMACNHQIESSKCHTVVLRNLEYRF